MIRLSAILILLVLFLPGCTPATESGEQRVERELLALDRRGHLAQLIVTGTGSPWMIAGEIPAGGAMFDGRPVISVPVPPGAETPIAPLLVGELAPGEGPGGLATLLATTPPDRLRAVGRRMGEDAVATGIRMGIVRIPMSEVARLSGGRGEPAEERVERLLRGVSESGLLLAVEVFGTSAEGERVRGWDMARVQAVESGLPRAAAGVGAATMIPAGVRVPALTGDTVPLPLSRVTASMLRRDHAWDGVVAADLSPPALNLLGTSQEEAAVAALAAGADLLLAPADPGAVLDALVTAVEQGRLGEQRVTEAVRRVLGMRLRAEGIGARGGDGVAPPGAAVRAARSPTTPPPGDSPQDTVAAAAPLSGAAATGVDPGRLARADAAINRALEQGLFTGAALAVARGGGVAHLRGFGVQADGAPVDPGTTLFDLASLTKVVATTTAVAMLVEEGRLRLDDRVQQHVPAFEGDGKELVTVRHLLAHTSGMAPGLWLYGSARSPEMAMGQALRQRLRRPAGEQAEYSDLGMILLARVAEVAAGEPLDRFLARRVFLPLGMERTMFVPPAAIRDAVIPTAVRNERGFVLQGVVHDANAFRLGGVAGHAGLFSTAEDVLRFGRMMLAAGSLDGVRVLQGETVSSFTRRQPRAGSRALGWDTPADRSSAGRFISARAYGHTGYTGTSIWIDPQLELVVVLLTNRTYDAGTPAAMLALRQAVHEAVATAVDDRPVPRRPGSR